MTHRMVSFENLFPLEQEELRNLANAAVMKLTFNAPLSAHESTLAAIILRSALRGEDPRQTLGINPRRGPPNHAGSLQMFLGAHYWYLRLTEPKELDIVARKIVAEKWKVSASHVYQVALKQKGQARLLMTTINRERFLSLIEGFHEAAR